jgi:hypothetical protein
MAENCKYFLAYKWRVLFESEFRLSLDLYTLYKDIFRGRLKELS